MFDDDVAMMVFSYAPCYTCHRVSVVSSYIAMRVTAATGGAAGKTAAPPQGLDPEDRVQLWHGPVAQALSGRRAHTAMGVAASPRTANGRLGFRGVGACRDGMRVWTCRDGVRCRQNGLGHQSRSHRGRPCEDHSSRKKATSHAASPPTPGAADLQ